MTASTPRQVDELRLLGGLLCLDFVNTVDPRQGPDPVEFLRCRADVLRWASHVGLAVPPEDDHLEPNLARLREAREREELARTLELREALYSVLSDLAERKTPDSRALEILETAYRRAIGRSRLSPAASFEWVSSGRGVEFVLDRVVFDAVRLLHSDRLARLKLCAADGECGWLFLDTTKSGTRRWCRMGGCGARAKGRRYRGKSETNRPQKRITI